MWGPHPRRISEARAERFWQRYWRIQQDHKPGFSTPILWHLALRGDPGAMVELGGLLEAPGGLSVAFSKAGLARGARIDLAMRTERSTLRWMPLTGGT